MEIKLKKDCLQSAAGREARAESSGLKEDLSELQNSLNAATQELDRERQTGGLDSSTQNANRHHCLKHTTTRWQLKSIVICIVTTRWPPLPR